MEAIVELTYRLYAVAMVTAEAMGWVSFIGGGIGMALTKSNPAHFRRYKGLLFGGAAALIAILVMDQIYQLITFVMSGTFEPINPETSMYSDQFLDNTDEDFDVSEFQVFAGVLARTSAVAGMASFAFGSGLYGISKRKSIYNHKSKRLLYGGIGLMAASVMEPIMNAATYVLFDALVM